MSEILQFEKMLAGVAAVTGGAVVAGLGIENVFNGRISSAEDYLRAALKGTIIGSTTGVLNALLPGGMSAGDYRLADFFSGAVEEGLWQILNQEELDYRKIFGSGLLEGMIRIVIYFIIY